MVLFCELLNSKILNLKKQKHFFVLSEKEQQEAIEHIDEVQNEIDRWVWIFHISTGEKFAENCFIDHIFVFFSPSDWMNRLVKKF